MGLPNVNIFYENGLLSTAQPNADGVLGLVCTGAPVVNGLTLGKASVIYSLQQLESDYKVTELNNPELYKLVNEFYAETGKHAELWLMAFPNTMTINTVLDVTKNNAKSLIDAANGRLRGLIVSVPFGTVNVSQALQSAQNLCNYSTNKDAPIFALLAYSDFDGDAIALPDLTQSQHNRVGVLIGDTVKNSTSAAVGLLGGRVAKNAVQRNIGAVKDGAVSSTEIFIHDKAAEMYCNIDLLHNKGYITFRTFTGKSGYFFTDDCLAAAVNDDYRHLTNRRIADKAHRVGYVTLLDELMSEIPVNSDGTLQAALAKNWQSKVENAIAVNMTANGELSADPTNPKDKGCKCFIDLSQNVLSTSRVATTLRVNPFGYGRYIDIYLGFNVQQKQ